MNSLLRQLPPIHELQQDKRFRSLVEKGQVSENRLTQCVQEAVDKLRKKIRHGGWDPQVETATLSDVIFRQVAEQLTIEEKPRLQRVINATGTVLHTNLGRAKLSEAAVAKVAEIAENYSNLEYNLDEGKRGSRHEILEELVKEVTGAEAAMVVNNNAAAVYLVLRALAKGKEVIVSRGELVEIGGSFRVSSIMAESGASLVEVGTTNKTHLYDYEEAMSDQTAMIMKVHTSNFKTIGFTSSVTAKELSPLTSQNGLLLYEDLGSGALFDFRQYKIGNEPTVKESLKNGADLVTFSGDKLLGGPQAGIIAGKKQWIDKLKKHQLARVLRVDKMTLAALEVTIKAYLDERSALKLPTVRAIVLTAQEIREDAERFRNLLSPYWKTDIVKDVSVVGGGTMPEVKLETWILLLSSPKLKAQELHNRLRSGTPAVVTRLKDNQLAFDFRTIEQREHVELLRCLQEFEQQE